MELKATKPGAVLPISCWQIIPHDDHGNAPGQTDQDQAHHILLVPGKERDGQKEHENGADDPVLDQRKGKNFIVSKHLPQLFVSHLRQGGYIMRISPMAIGMFVVSDLKLVPEIDHAGEYISPAHADEHGQKDPKG